MPAVSSSFRWSALHLRTKGLIVVALPVVPLAVFWSLTSLALINRSAPASSAGSSLAVQAALSRTFGTLIAADAAARDHLLTDNVGARHQYDEAIRRLPSELSILDGGVIDLGMRESLGQLHAAIADEVSVLALLAGDARSGLVLGEREALDRSTANLERVREITSRMQATQTALAVQGVYDQDRAGVILMWVMLIASVLCGAGGVLAAVLVARGLSRRISVLSRNAERLARGEAIHSPPLGEDEIGQLDRQFREASRLLRSRESELRARTNELEAANRELEAFGYSVSHDLRAPLRAIDGFSEVLESDYRDQLDAEGLDALARVRRAAQRMGILIDELLNLSRLTRADLHRERLDVSGIAAAIVDDLARHHPSRHVDVRVEPGLAVDADPQLVRIALQNLIDNAWKYTARSAQAHIEIGSTPNGTARTFHVRDNGAGFDMKYAGRMFDPFQRLHAAREFEGTGIGLAIVQRVVHRHGGRIWAEGAVDAGAVFHFTFEPEVAETA